MNGLAEPPPPEQLANFPSITWAAHQPLWRIHRVERSSVHFATEPLGARFNPTQPLTGFGTWYLATHPRGAFAEVFGRTRTIDRAQVDARVLAQVFLPSDLRLADLTNPTVLGRFGVTGELSASGEAGYELAARWATALWAAGFAGIHYASRHDPELSSRSVAVFGKEGDEFALEDSVLQQPLTDVADEMADHFGYVVVSGRPL